jgi:hypothetical protein
MNGGFEDILDRELIRVLDGRARVDDCCAAHPGFAGELKPLLDLALAGRGALQVEVPAAAREATREKLMARMSEDRNLSPPRRSGARRMVLLRPLALAAGLLLLLFAGTAIAAGGAEPDGVLYPLKQRLESARTTLALQNLDQARVEIGHANARLDELQTMVGDNKYEYIADLLARYNIHLDASVAYANAAAADGEDTTEVDEMIRLTRERHDTIMESLIPMVPEEEARALREELGTAGIGMERPQTGEGDQIDGQDGAGQVEDQGSGAPSGGDVERHEGDSRDSQQPPGSGQDGNDSSESDSKSGGHDGSDDESRESSLSQPHNEILPLDESRAEASRTEQPLETGNYKD